MKAKKGKGRSISTVKRSNQRKNKLIKRGKLKPKSSASSPYHRANEIKKAHAGHRNDVAANAKRFENEKAGSDEEEHSGDEDEGMDLGDAMALTGGILPDGGFSSMELKALRRYQDGEQDKKQTKLLLPIKTKSGIIMRSETIEKEDSDMEGDDQEGDEEEHPEDEEEDTPETFLGVLSQREVSFEEQKVLIGNMATNFLAAPEERIHLLEKLVSMVGQEVTYAKKSSFKLLTISITELLKDVIPNYKVATHEESGLQKKDTLHLVQFEKALLQCVKTFLVKLERMMKSLSPDLVLHSMQCMCSLAVTHPHFNYATNIVQFAVPFMNSSKAEIRLAVLEAMRAILKSDRKGEISLCVASNVKKYLNGKKYVCKYSCFLDCLLSLRLAYLDSKSNGNDDENKNEKFKQLSKREKKQKKKLEKVEREMLEARAEESARTREKFFTEAAKRLFEIVFQIIKRNPSPTLMTPALKCISRFCHYINVDFLPDILKSLVILAKSPELRPLDRLQCIKTAFDITSGPGEALIFDSGDLVAALHDLLLVADLNLVDVGSVIEPVLDALLVRRRKQVSSAMARSVSKAACSAALHLTDPDMQKVLGSLTRVSVAHKSAFESTLEAEEDAAPMPATAGALGRKDSHKTLQLWELSLLVRHANPEVAKLTKTLFGQ